MASLTLGAANSDRINGTPNEDIILGLSGFDTLFGNEGNDSLYGNQQPDVLDGGPGNDDVRGGKDSDQIFGNLDRDTLWGDLGNDTINGGLGNDILFGNESEDTLFGDAGDDEIYGNSGNDTLRGGEGNDLMRGGQGVDRLFGEGGNDILVGDRDTDTLSGGDGDDVFVLRKNLGNATLAEADIITDFGDRNDVIALAEGLKFQDLNISQGTGIYFRDTIIQDATNGQFLALLQGVDSSDINRGDFILPGTLAFSAPTFIVNEEGTPIASVTVTRSDGSDVPVSVAIALTNGSAISGADYESAPIVVNFAAGDTAPKTLTIPIVSDTLPEATETINLALSSPTGGAVLGGQNTAVLQILDNDIQSAPKLILRNPNGEVNNTDLFGFAIAAVGNNILIGAPEDDSVQTNAGAAYLFDPATGVLLTKFSSPNASTFDQFGWSVAAVGNKVAIGARLDNGTGTAYLFDSTTGTLTQTLAPPPGTPAGLFGEAIAAIGNNVLVGAPGTDAGSVDSGAVYLYDSTTGALRRTFVNPTPNPGEQFGSSIAAIGNNVLIGSPFDSGTGGAAYLLDSTTGALLRTFTNPNPAAGASFGISVAAAGNNLLVQSLGATYLYDGVTGALLQTFQNSTPKNGAYAFQNSVAAIGNSILVAPSIDIRSGGNVGAVSLFDTTTGGLLNTLASPNPSVLETFGNSVAGLANAIAIGSPDGINGGAVYLFE